MKNDKNMIIWLLVVIIVLLGTLVVLFATGTINFNTGETNNNDISEEVNDNNQNVVDDNENDIIDNNTNQNSEIIYYQWYPEEDESLGGSHSIDILELYSDGTAKLYGGKRNSSGWSYEGTYTESDTQIVFTGKATAGDEELLDTDEYVKTFKKQGNSLYDDRNFEYSKVTKDELKG